MTLTIISSFYREGRGIHCIFHGRYNFYIKKYLRIAMTRKCSVLHCGGSPQAFAFPSFKRYPARFLQWLSSCGNHSLLDITPEKMVNRFICEAHFAVQHRFSKKLTTDAIPTLQLPGKFSISVSMSP